MASRRTKLMSGFVAVLMLVSMFAMFVLPANAGSADVVSSTGLVDKTAIPNIKDGLKSGVTEYQVNSRAGFEKWAEIVAGNNELTNYTIWQTADVDMGWEPFTGIGGYADIGSEQKNPSSRATFDGNGFVITGLYIMKPTGSQVGFFNRTHMVTIRNMGIASGLVIGGNYVGSIIGYGNSGDKLINCWSAATVVMVNGNDGAGGLAGRTAGAGVEIINSYNLGLVFHANGNAGGLTGWYNGTITVKNSYVGGDVVSGMTTANDFSTTVYPYDEAYGHNAIVRGNVVGGAASTGVNNYYVKHNENGLKSLKEANTAGIKCSGGANNVANIDDGTAVAPSELKTLASKLNGTAGNVGEAHGYTLKYVDTAEGYPALGYYNGEELKVCRVAADDAFNVAENEWAEKNELFKEVSDRRLGGFVGTEENPDLNKLDTITVSDAGDLFILALVTAQNNAIVNYTKNKTATITADIDASVNPLVPALKYNIPLCMNVNLNGGTLDGGFHVIRNWKSYAPIAGGTPRGAFICNIMDGAVVKNLGMIDATSIYDYYYKSGYSYPTLMIEQVNGKGSVVENCFALGDIYLLKSGANNFNNNSAVVSRTMAGTPDPDDGIPSLTMNNVWGQSTLHLEYNGTTAIGRALGSTKAVYGTGRSAVLNNVFYLASAPSFGYEDNTTDELDLQPNKALNAENGELAAYLNNTVTGALYTVKNGETVFGTAENATRTLTVNKVMENGTVLDTLYYYYNGGAAVTIPAIAGYELDAGSLPADSEETTFTMPTENWTLTYVAEGVDYSGAEEILGEMNAYDLELFVDASAIEGVKALAEAAIAFKAQEQTPDVIVAANAAITTAVNAYNALDVSVMALKDTYPNVPKFADYDLYKDFAPKNWGISTKEDWVKATEQKTNFSGVTIHLLNDVDMDNTDVDPLSKSTDFAGTLDGHGYVFENFKMVYDVTANGVGLVGGLGSAGIIKNLGLASGTMDFVYKATGDGYGVGAFAGHANGGAQFINCWNGLTMNVTSAEGFNKNPSVGGIVGRGYNNSIIDGCYFVGTINTPTHAAGLNDWGQTDAYIRNSFSAGTLNAGGIAVIRNNNNAKADHHVNSYALGYNYANGGGDAFSGALNKAPYKQDVETYSNGVLAWLLNSNRTIGAETYYTLEDGKTVFGTAANQTVRVTMRCNGLPDEYFYINAGEEITLNYADNATYTVTSGEGSSVEGKVLTVGPADVVVTVTVEGMNYKGLNDAIAYYAERDVTLYADNEYGSLAELLATLTEKMENDAFASQGELDAYVSVLNAYELKNEYPNLPVASDFEKYEGAKGWLIKTAADLEYVGLHEDKIPANTTLYLANDLDLTGSSFAGASELNANFDGCNHTLSGLAASNNAIGIFYNYRGSYIKNLKLDNMHTKGGYGRALLVAQYDSNGALTIENVHVTNSSVTATGNGANAMGLLLSRTNGTGGNIVIKNCTVKNSTVTSDAAYTGDLGNVGFIVGQMHNGRQFTITDVLVEGCTMSARTGFATGIAFGCAEGACSVTLNNVAVLNNKRTNSRITWHTRGILLGTVKGGSLLDLTNVIILNNQQNQADQFELVDGQAGAENFNVAFNMTTSDTAAMEGYKAKNCYIDLGGFHNSGKLNKENGNMVNVKPADYAKIAYTVNADTAATAYKWEATADEKFAMDTDGEGLPAKITFYATDAVGENTYENVLYTNAAGKLVGLNQELLDAAIWSEEETLATKVFNGDSIVVGSIPVIHECEFGNPTHIEGTNKHLLSCIVDPGCTETQEVDCVFDQIKTVDSNAAPEAAAHIRSCVCGNAQQAELCADANGDQYLRAGEDPTCTEPGEETYGCEFCGYEKTVPVSETGHNYTGNWTMDTVAPGAVQTHSRVCANECGIPETERCTYTGEWEEVPGQEARRKYCDENCGSYIDELLSVGAITIAGEAGIAGKQMTVDVLMNENPGLAGADVAITYDSDVMDLESVAAGDFELDLLFKGPATAPDANGMVTVIANFAHFGTIEGDGVLLKLTFNVKDDAAAGEYDFAVSAHASDFDGNEFDFAPFTGTVEITNIIPGDINGNGYVTIADAVLMLRVAAGETDLPEGLILDAGDVITDTNQGDLKINTDDVVMVLKYLNGEIAEL